MLALLGKTTVLMENLGFLWIVQSGLELNLWDELENNKSLDELMLSHPEWNRTLLDHWLEQAYRQDLLVKDNERFCISKLGKAIKQYKDHGLEAMYTEMSKHWSLGFAHLSQLIANQEKKLVLSSDMEDKLISKASLASEPFVWPFLRQKCAKEGWLRVLDLGCGEGLYLKKLTDQFPLLQGVGIEMNSAVTLRAQATIKASEGRLEILCENILSLLDGEKSLPLLNRLGKFDICLLNNSIYYFSQEQRLAILDAVKKLLTPNGQIGILTAVRKGDPAPIFRTHIPQNLMSLYLACHQGFQGLPTQEDMTTLFLKAGYTSPQIYVMPLGTSHYFFSRLDKNFPELQR